MKFQCDCSAPESAAIGNRFSNLSFWHYLGTTPDEQMWHEWAEAMPDGWLKQHYPWLEEMQIFIASGGAYLGYPRQKGDIAPCEFNRDLFKNPADRSVLDDYDFAPLVRACRNMLRQGVRPCLKLHGVPLKFSSQPKIDWFRVNCRPPDDYRVYADYLSALVRAMVAAFGLGEVRAWRWFVGTEMENKNWWEAQDESAETTQLEFVKLYDWSVFAIERVLGLGGGRAIGAHAMMTGGIWKPDHFLEHCRSGRNHATGKTGSRFDFFAISYYDRAPGCLESDEWQTNLTGAGGDLANFDPIVERTRRALDSHGFGALPIEVSEGGMLFGMDGKWLWHGLCPGGVFDASWTAWAFWKMLETGTACWSRWALLRTGGLFHGPEAAATHAMRMISEIQGDLRLPVAQDIDDIRLIRVVAGFSPAKDRVRLLVFHHAADVTRPTDVAQVDIRMANLPFDGPVRIRRRVLDKDHGDFWPRWEQDRSLAGLEDKDYFRSRDQFDVAHALVNPAHVALWRHRAREYEALAAFPPTTTEIRPTAGGVIDLHDERPCFSVVLYELEPASARP